MIGQGMTQSVGRLDGATPMRVLRFLFFRMSRVTYVKLKCVTHGRINLHHRPICKYTPHAVISGPPLHPT